MSMLHIIMRYFARTRADVEPVWVIRGELLVRASLDKVYPDRDLELARALQVGRIGGNECVGAAIIVCD
jgi:hypothetical protein